MRDDNLVMVELLSDDAIIAAISNKNIDSEAEDEEAEEIESDEIVHVSLHQIRLDILMPSNIFCSPDTLPRIFLKN
ncbi:hypothetical protein QE152_g36164 [Popillia japonica]|uniref:Uncharacterized protein n=1 Tax=Popillia japonica TaxID=7064 RepID=A0AAW1IDZ2_POPJA